MWYYFKSTTRRIRRNLLNSTVKLLGITVGLLTLLLITIYVVHEASYDKHIADSQNIYRVVRNWQNSTIYDPSTSASLLNEMMRTFPEIEAGTRLHFLHDRVVSYQDKVIQENGIFGVDSLFIKTFNLKLLQGDIHSALNSPGTLIISQSKSKMLFGNENPLGKTLEFEGEEFTNQNKTVTITGVYADYPTNTHFKPDFLLSLKSFEIYSRKEHSNHSLMTYVRLKKGTNQHLFESKLPGFIKSFYGTEYYDFAKSTYLLQPITNIHLDTWVYPYGYETDQGDSRTLYMFPLLGLLIFIIASINYFNLTIAEGHNNINTFGINKIMGADRFYYLKTFLWESGILIGSAIVLTILFGHVLLPQFGTIMGRHLDFRFFNAPGILVFCGVILSCIILLTAVFPALIFSGKNIQHSITVRKGLPTSGNYTDQISQVLQFTICIFFIIASFVSYKQLHFVYRETNSTMKTENVLVIQNARYLENQRDAFKQELSRLPGVKSVSLCNAVPGFPDFSNWGIPIDKAVENVHVSVFECDPDYLNTLNIEMVKGRFFDPENQSDKEAIVLNETAIKKLGWEAAPIGKRYRVGKNFTVIGVTRDVHFEALQYMIFPQAYLPNRHENSASKVIVKLETKNMSESIAQINSLWKRFIPQRDMYYRFMDEAFAKWYKTEQKTATLAVILSVIAIFLANISLFASILSKIQRRIKEIGIRKVNGAKISEILAMLNRDFVKWVVIAFVIATPLAYFAMLKWLENFAYKTELSWWIFAFAGFLALGIALLTVSWQSWKAATRNPVEALRYE